MATFISHSAAQTAEFAAQIAVGARAGWLMGLIGEIGAGKTHFTQGFARGLGITDPILSPTFALVHFYESGRVPLCHIDLYRLETVDQIVAAGLEDYFTPAGITLVEWWDRWPEKVDGVRRFSFEVLGETERRITYDDLGP